MFSGLANHETNEAEGDCVLRLQAEGLMSIMCKCA